MRAKQGRYGHWGTYDIGTYVGDQSIGIVTAKKVMLDLQQDGTYRTPRQDT